MIRAAIVGMGWWGKTLVEAVADSDRIRFTVGASRTPTPEIQAFAATHGMKIVDGFDAVLADPEVDAVVLAPPPTGHSTQIAAAAKAGKHVYCEKPFTFTKREADTAVEAMRKAGKTLALGYNRRFHPEMGKLRDMIRAGELGTICHLEATMSVPNGLLPGGIPGNLCRAFF